MALTPELVTRLVKVTKEKVRANIHKWGIDGIGPKTKALKDVLDEIEAPESLYFGLPVIDCLNNLQRQLDGVKETKYPSAKNLQKQIDALKTETNRGTDRRAAMNLDSCDFQKDVQKQIDELEDGAASAFRVRDNLIARLNTLESTAPCSKCGR